MAWKKPAGRAGKRVVPKPKGVMSVHNKGSNEGSWLVLDCSDLSGDGALLDDELETKSDTGDDVSEGLPHCISRMLCGDNMPYKRLLKTLTELQGETNLTLPSIVVCGVQSHGKSSTLERIAQLEVFPRDSSLCTRMVVRLMLRNSGNKDDKRTIKVRIFDTEENKGIRPSWVDVTKDTPVSDATGAIMQDFVDSKHKGDSSAIDARHELQVMLQAPDVPTIDLVDLPGIDSLAEDAAPMLLAKQFLAKEHTLVVAVACASDKQIGASAIWRLLAETENPAVVALTHMDLSRHSKADMVDILNKQTKFVADCGTVHSVIPVVNRDSLSAGAQVPLQGVLASEEASLTTKLEQIGVAFDPSRHGICAVVGALGNMLHEYMANTWGLVELYKLVFELVPIAKELGELGVRPDVLTQDNIFEAIETAWADLISGERTIVSSITVDEFETGNLEQLLSDELDGRMEAALGSVQRMLVKSIQSTCAEPPVKLVRFNAIIELCKKALQDVFEADKSNIKSGIVSSMRRMIKAARLSPDSDPNEVATLMLNVRVMVSGDVEHSLLRRGAFLSAVRSQLETGLRPALVVDADAARRRQLERKVELVGEAANALLGLMPTCPGTKAIVADIGRVVRAAKSGNVNSDVVRACSQWTESGLPSTLVGESTKGHAGSDSVQSCSQSIAGDLHSASARGNETLVQALLFDGANVHARNNDGRLALHLACEKGHEGVAKLLLGKGADVHAEDKYDRLAALHWGCLKGHKGVAKLLLDYGANVHAKSDNGDRPLHKACLKGHESVAKLLLDNGADVHAKSDNGDTPLHKACLKGHEGVAKLLLDNGAKVGAKEDDGWLALHLACQSGHEGVAKLLLDNGADVHEKEDDGWLALHLACQNGHEGVARLLLDNGADVHAITKIGSTALHLACQNGHEGVAKLLLDNGADVHAKTKTGWRPLHKACRNGHESVAKLLLDNGADMHAKDTYGSRALDVACAYRRSGVATLLRNRH